MDVWHSLIQASFNLEMRKMVLLKFKQSQIQNTGIGNNYNPVGISEAEVESILKKSVKAKLKLLEPWSATQEDQVHWSWISEHQTVKY